MILKLDIKKAFAVLIIWVSMLLGGIPANAQSILETSSIAGGSSVYVYKKSSKSRKSTYFAKSS
ncbi:MAG: hypothetical protein ACK5NT_06665 [Pyrinomonadaceae bacterium]